VDGYGGAIASFGHTGSSSPSVAQSKYIGNASGGYGGAIASYGNAGTISPRITQATFSGCSSGAYGGAIASLSNCSAGVSRLVISHATLIGKASEG